MTTQVQNGQQRFVVGVDGSEESRAALQWSADEAVAHGARLEAVCAWELPFSGLASSYAPAPAGLPSPVPALTVANARPYTDSARTCR